MKNKFLAICLVLSILSKAQFVNLVVNSNFNSGFTGFTSLTPSGVLCLANTATVAANFTLKCPSWSPLAGNGGSGLFLIINGQTTTTNQPVWQQTVNVCKGKLYTFSFWAGMANPITPLTSLSIKIGTNPAVNIGPLNTLGWTQYSTTYSSLSSGPIVISILQNAPSNNHYGIDDVSFGYSCTPISVAGSSSICSGSGTTFTANGASTYTWFSPSGTSTGTTATFNPSTTTVYTVTGNDGCGCTTTKIFTLTVVQPCLPISVVGSNTICPGSSTTYTANGAQNYTWTSSVGTSTGTTATLNPTTTTVYTITGSDICGCITVKIFTLTVVPPCTPLSIAGSNTLCSGTSKTYTASGAQNYTWTSATGTSTGTTVTLNPTVTTVYTVTGSDTCRCIRTKTFTITVIQPCQPITIAGTNTICSGSSATYTASGAQNYTWTSATGTSTGTTATLNPTTTTVYTVTGSDVCGCVTTKIFTLFVVPKPTITISGTQTICASAGVPVLLTASGASNYTWSSNAGSANTNTVLVLPGTTTIYTVTGSNTIGSTTCTSTATYTVFVLACKLTSIESELLSQPDSETVKIFPNPNKGIFTITFNLNKDHDVFVYDAMGRQVISYLNYKGQNQKIDISTFPSGFYIVKIVCDGTTYSQKIIKE
jgi:hypothetical protein